MLAEMRFRRLNAPRLVDNVTRRAKYEYGEEFRDCGLVLFPPIPQRLFQRAAMLYGPNIVEGKDRAWLICDHLWRSAITTVTIPFSTAR